jgi:putative addiction module killer protein
MKTTIQKTPEYTEWFERQAHKEKAQIEKRLAAIHEHDHYGDVKPIDEIAELRWANGRRLYFGRIGSQSILLLTGGNKNGQSKDITQAKAIYARYVAN